MIDYPDITAPYGQNNIDYEFYKFGDHIQYLKLLTSLQTTTIITTSVCGMSIEFDVRNGIVKFITIYCTSVLHSRNFYKISFVTDVVK